jgi:hypothetical protein
MDFFIVEINRDQLAQLEKSCSFWGLFYWKRSLQNKIRQCPSQWERAAG